MPRYGVSIEKEISFRGVAQPFSNVYYYDAPVPPEADVDLENLVDDIVAWEKQIHATTITFTRGRLWSAGGGPAQNQMIIDKTLSGAGSLVANSSGLDRERAFLVRMRAGVDSRGRPVYLRKWYHSDAQTISGVTISAGMMAQTAQLTGPMLTAIKSWGDQLKTFEYSPGNEWELVAKSGRTITGETEAHPWLEHHQLGDEWRG